MEWRRTLIEVPSNIKQQEITDWAELSCLTDNQGSISKSTILKILEESAVSKPDVVLSNIWLEIDRRHRLIETFHPIKALIGRLERMKTWEENLPYTFQLLLASHYWYKETTIKGEPWNKTAKIFEELSTAVIKEYLGGDAINIGWPRGNGIPRGFRQCLDFVCNRLREKRGYHKSYNLPTIKDKGVDVVAWKSFPDRRYSQIFILGQCAAGKDWKEKADDIKLTTWQRFIEWMAPPTIAFTFPYICQDEDNEWRELSDQSGGILLDRLRITSGFVPSEIYNSLLRKINEWCKTQIAKLPRLNN